MPRLSSKTVAPRHMRPKKPRNNKRLLTRHPYLNYLRCFKRTHPTYGYGRIMREGAKEWKRLEPADRACYAQKEFIKRTEKRSYLDSNFNLFPHQQIPFDFVRQSMRASRNINRSWRNTRKMPQIIQIAEEEDFYW